MQLIAKFVSEVESVCMKQEAVECKQRGRELVCKQRLARLYSIFSCLATTDNVHHLSNKKVTIQLVNFHTMHH